jgi:hypothetical protein
MAWAGWITNVPLSRDICSTMATSIELAHQPLDGTHVHKPVRTAPCFTGQLAMKRLTSESKNPLLTIWEICFKIRF